MQSAERQPQKEAAVARPQPHKRKERSSIRASGFIASIIVGVLVLWELSALLRWIDPRFTSSPIAVARMLPHLLTDRGVASALLTTLEEMLVAFACTVALGIAAGVALGVSPTLRRAYMGPISFLLSTPKPIFLPVFVYLFGIGKTGAIAYAVFEGVFYVIVNVVGGIGFVRGQHVRMAFAYGASRLRSVLSIILPSALPGIMTGIWNASRHSVSAVLTVQLFVSVGGVGTLIRGYTASFQTARVMGLIVVIAAAAILFGSVWSVVERRLEAWRVDVQR